MIGQTITLTFVEDDAELKRAFHIFCIKHKCKTGRAGIRAMIRELREFKDLNEQSTISEPESQEKNQEISKAG